MAVVDRDGVNIAYDVHGEGAVPGSLPLLLTHGFGSSSAMWEPNLPALSAGRRVVTWDIRGHGASDSPADLTRYTQDACLGDMVAVLDAAGIDCAAVGGLSLGGFLSLALTRAHPERVAALLLFDTGPGYRKEEGRRRWNAYAEATAAALEVEGLGALGESPETRRARHDPAGLARAARGILTQHDDVVIAALGAIAVPTLVLVGELDAPFRAAADYMAGAIPGARSVVLEGAGHAANLDRPEAFDRVVVEFLDAVATEPAAGGR